MAIESTAALSASVGLIRRSREFRFLWIAHTVSVFGDRVTLVALPTVAILTLHTGGLLVGVLTSAWAIAWGAFALPAGVWTDRLPRRRIMVACDLVRLALLASIPAAYVVGALTYWQLLGIAVLAASANVFFSSASTTFIPAVLPAADFTEANARLELSSSTSQLAGPSLAGVLIGLVGAPLALLADTASFLGSAILLQRIPVAEKRNANGAPRHFRRELADGVRVIREHPILMRITLAAALSNFGLGASQAVLLLFIYRGLHVPPLLAGVTLAIGACGNIAGAVLAPRFARRFGTGQLLFLATTLEGLALLPIELALLGLPILCVAFALAAQGFFNPLWNVNAPTVRQTLVPLALQGRVAAVLRFVGFGIVPLGAIAGGALGQLLAGQHGAAAGYGIALAIGTLVAAVSGLPLASHRFRTFRLDQQCPQRVTDTPSPAVPPAPTSAEK